MTKSRDKIDKIKERSAEALRKNLIRRRVRAKAISVSEEGLYEKDLKVAGFSKEKKAD